MIEKLQNKLNKQAKGAKLYDNIRSWRMKKVPKLSLKYLKNRK